MSSLPTENENNKNHASQYGLIREIDYSVEMIKLKICERLDELKEIFVNKAAAAKSSQTKTKKAESPFVKSALFSFYEAVSKELDSLSPELLNKQRPFSPFLANVLEVKANIGFNYGANSYSQKHNMIITCPSNSTVHFYDATTLLPLKQRNRVQLKSSVVQMSFCPETDTYLMGCAYGDIYAYDASSNNIKRVLKYGESFVLAITFLNSTHYAFSSCKSGQLFIGNLETEDAVPISFGSKDSDSWYLHHINQKNLLFSGLASGSVILYHTSKLPKLPVLATIQAHKIGKYVTTIQNVMINKKEYIITGGNDHTIKIWHIIKGKMRLLKVLQIEEDISCMVYLEDYKMIATTHHREYIKFFSLPSGKLQSTLKLDMSKSRNIFLMRDKNTIGVADLAKNIIKMVQLHLPEDNALLREL